MDKIVRGNAGRAETVCPKVAWQSCRWSQRPVWLASEVWYASLSQLYGTRSGGRGGGPL